MNYQYLFFFNEKIAKIYLFLLKQKTIFIRFYTVLGFPNLIKWIKQIVLLLNQKEKFGQYVIRVLKYAYCLRERFP